MSGSRYKTRRLFTPKKKTASSSPQKTKEQRKPRGLLLFSLFLFLGLISGCTDPSASDKAPPYLLVVKGEAQGTTFQVKFFTPDTAKNWGKAIRRELDTLDNSLSTYKETSTISQFNRSDSGIRADSHLIRVVRTARKVWEATQGAFDPTIMPLVRAWGFGPKKKRQETPDSADIDSLLRLVGMSGIRMIEKDGAAYLRKEEKGTELDLNAIAQGYSVDHLSQWLREQGITRFMVEIGGEVRASGKKKDGSPWRIGIDRPRKKRKKGAYLGAVELHNASLATSGNYRKFYEKDGEKYHHTIDPRTGYPVKRRLLSATVLTRNCALADGYATAFMVMGWEHTLSFLEKEDHPIQGAYLVGVGEKEGELITHDFQMDLENL